MIHGGPGDSGREHRAHPSCVAPFPLQIAYRAVFFWEYFGPLVVYSLFFFFPYLFYNRTRQAIRGPRGGARGLTADGNACNSWCDGKLPMMACSSPECSESPLPRPPAASRRSMALPRRPHSPSGLRTTPSASQRRSWCTGGACMQEDMYGDCAIVVCSVGWHP